MLSSRIGWHTNTTSATLSEKFLKGEVSPVRIFENYWNDIRLFFVTIALSLGVCQKQADIFRSERGRQVLPVIEPGACGVVIIAALASTGILHIRLDTMHRS